MGSKRKFRRRGGVKGVLRSRIIGEEDYGGLRRSKSRRLRGI